MSQSTEAGVLAGAAHALQGLKDFQRETVDYVFERLFFPDGSGRFLVADEVGLGKTMIAKGVIARTLQHLRDRVDRLDVVYICSNEDIARQNVSRLKLEGEHVTLASRLTLLPREARRLKDSPSRINFISFTPATSFDLSGGLGHVEERLLLHAMLTGLWGLGTSAPAMNVLQGGVDSERFRARVRSMQLSEFDPTGDSTRFFAKELEKRAAAARARGEPDLRARFEDLCQAYPTYRSQPDVATSRLRSRLVGELRSALASGCVATLEPDLVVLDEFQRFSHLLDGQDEASELARALFEFEGVRTLLLSATPYKMYTTATEAGGEDHYQDFVRTLRFLERKPAGADDIDGLFQQYRRGLMQLGDVERRRELEGVRRKLEDRLRRVMVRTERLASTPDRNGMLKEIPSSDAKLTRDDALGYLALQKVARLCDHHDTLDYWKSTPYALSFMDEGYKLKRSLLGLSEDGQARFELARALTAPGNLRLPWSSVERYAEIDLGNARMRELVAQTLGRGAHRMLWLSPSLPYYRLRGPWGEPGAKDVSKRLVFSSWKFAPRAIAALLSFEAERRMFGREQRDGYSSERRRRRGAALRFQVADGRPTGMPILALLYPCVFLARACDPVRFAAESFQDGTPGEGFVDLDEVLSAACMQIEVALRRLPPGTPEGRVDERWYWAAPLLLDRAIEPHATETWFDRDDLPGLWMGGEASEEQAEPSWQAHVETAREMLRGSADPLGRRPDDLVEVLAEMAIAAPGVTLLRSMLRVLELRTDALGEVAGVRIRDAAAMAAWAFRALFNQPEFAEMLHREVGEPRGLPYWRTVLRYSVDGCLQAVLDEYAHVLRDHLGLVTGSAAERVHEIAENMAKALSLRTASLTTYDVEPSESGRTVRQEVRRMRCHFALRFGDERSDDGQVATRADSVRKAFNSPFWPFVVATTSVGQEGLDFHAYCHAVVHWNLPSNPVDLEQREGRVHRYKGHAVRKNVARTHGLEALNDAATDIWEVMFEKARRSRPEGSTDIVPYWVYPVDDGARIERHVLALPLSREFERAVRLSKSLAIYRLAFGQPRQDDLINYLVEAVEPHVLEQALAATRIDLSPFAAEAAPLAILT
ncbi:helicase-related protein [Corallococcus aberystwythensis]|uniref:Helicase n=1 Tax=Corallococcus aberystwythensis TaxID=2316722 RepID=A0A3A8QH10_9BACT|nr:helicase-related protein [Corallococcus aberystwythensis]RKH68029.1 helicase [Corallococcus aberystwythensis]